MASDLQSINNDLSELLNSENGCQYTDIENLTIPGGVRFSSKGNLNVLHVNIHSLHKNIDSLLLLLNDL